MYQHRPQRLRDRRVRGAHRPASSAVRRTTTSRSSPTSRCTRRTSRRRPRASDRRKFRTGARAAHAELRPGRREPLARASCATSRSSAREETHAINVLYRKRIRSLQAVDRGVARLVHTLRVTKQLDNTYIVFASDNGFHLGQHRMPAGKQTPYETDIHVPLIVRGPGVRAGAHVDAARGQHRPRADVRGDGRRARAVVHRRSIAAPAAARRPARRTGARRTCVEHRIESGMTQPARAMPGRTVRRSNRPTPTRPGPTAGPATGRSATPCCSTGAPRSPTTTASAPVATSYVQYANGERELYDLRHDPDEIAQPRRHPPGARAPRSAHRIAQLRRCGGRGCRRAEDRPVPVTPATTWMSRCRSRAATMRSLR